MTTSTITRLLIAALCLFAVANSQCVKFYEDYNFKGRSFSLCKNGDVPANWNDRVSSFIVPAGYSLNLYQNYGYGGKAFGPYAAGSYNVPASFNDQLSSIKISKVQPPKQSCAVFYEHKDLQGDSFQLCSSGNVPNNWDNQATSFSVPAGYSVYLYQHADFTGESLGPYTQGKYNIPEYFNNRLTSAKLILNQPKPQPQPVRRCPTFYTAASQKGESFQLCNGGNVPAKYNDQVSSFYVPRGYEVHLYKNYGLSGEYYGPYSEGSYSVPAFLRNQVSSVAVKKLQW